MQWLWRLFRLGLVAATAIVADKEVGLDPSTSVVLSAALGIGLKVAERVYHRGSNE